MSNRAIVFAKRNITEILRSPVSWIFGLALPIGIFIIMQIIVKSVGAEAAAHVPMFGVERFTGGVLLFGAAFLSTFAAILISGDRAQSFLSRLYASPMTAAEYILGYMLAELPLAALQNATVFITALCFGLPLTWGILPAFLFSVLFSMLFIALGVIFGSVMNGKNAPAVCSAVVQAAALLSGMWFDLDAIGGGFATFCRVLPFANVYDLVRYTLTCDFSHVWLPFLIAFAYTAALVGCAIVAFRKRAMSK